MIDEAVDRLIAVFAAAGLPPVLPPGPEIETVLTELADSVAPLLVPEQLLAFWRRVDPATVCMSPYPALTSPAFALECWREHVKETGLPVPGLMFPFAYQSHDFLFVELESSPGSAGTVFAWGYGGTPWIIQHVDLTAYLDQLTTMVELGEWRAELNDQGDVYYRFDPDELWDGIAEVRLPASASVDGYGTQRELDEDVRAWPPHWRAANGYTDDAAKPRGASTTVASLLTEAAAGHDASGIVHARIGRLHGGGDGYQLVIDDGSGRVEIWCPARLSPYGPVVGRWFEFDVVVFAGPVERPDISGLQCEISERALDHDLAGAQELAAELFRQGLETPRAGLITALRPLD